MLDRLGRLLESERRARYERLYKQVREARQALERARALGDDGTRLRLLRERLRDLRARLAAWQRRT